MFCIFFAATVLSLLSDLFCLGYDSLFFFQACAVLSLTLFSLGLQLSGMNTDRTVREFSPSSWMAARYPLQMFHVMWCAIAGGGLTTPIGRTMREMSMWQTASYMIAITSPGAPLPQNVSLKLGALKLSRQRVCSQKQNRPARGECIDERRQAILSSG